METGVAGKKSVFKGYDGHPCGVEVRFFFLFFFGFG